MVIVHVIQTLDPANGGPPAVVARLAAAQAALGHSVTVLAGASPDAAERTAASLRGISSIDRVRFVSAELHSNLRELVRPALPVALAPLLERVDWVHLHGVWEPMLVHAARRLVAGRIPYCVCHHGLLDRWAMQQKPFKKRLALALGCRTMLNRARFLHLLNADDVAGVAPLALRAPVRVLPNGVFLEEIEPLPKPGTFRSKQPQLGQRPFVLFLSRLHTSKGLDYLADAFALVARQHPDAMLVVAGPDGGARAEFERRIADARIADRVLLTGGLFGPDKYAAMVDCAAFCLPSRKEGFSMAITEAMACRKPVVISPECHFPEVAQSSAGAIAPLEPGAIAAALLEYLANPSRAAADGACGRLLVETSFTWPAIAAKCVDFYREFGASEPEPVSSSRIPAANSTEGS